MNLDPFGLMIWRIILLLQVHRGDRSKMERGKLAEQIKARILQRKQQQQKQRPQVEVMRLQGVFMIEKHSHLKKDLRELEEYLRGQGELLQKVEEEANELINTGSRACPRIILLPEFIASERVEGKVKEFYRKTANSFLRLDILRHREYTSSLKDEQKYMDHSSLVGQLTVIANKTQEEQIKNTNLRRLAILKQQLRLQRARKEQQMLKNQIQAQQSENKEKIEEYQLKKGAVENAGERMSYIQAEIKEYKRKIQAKFSPQAYREFLKETFALQLKNEALTNNLNVIRREISSLRKEMGKLDDIDSKKISVRKDKGRDRCRARETYCLPISSSFCTKGEKASKKRLKTSPTTTTCPSHLL